jgi:hypothetical protein
MVNLHRVNYSKARFQTKIDTIDSQLRKDNKENIGKFKFRLNEDYVFPELMNWMM